MIKIGVFILPNKKFRKLILKQKKNILKKFGFQRYVNHLPHCTLCVLNVSNKVINEKKFKKTIKLNNKKKYYIEKNGIFLNDPITKGDTLFFQVKKNQFLNKLQIFIIKNFYEYKLNKKLIFKNKKMRKNYSKYGYPFVGSNWKPHFTIASISKKVKKKSFINKFKKVKIGKLSQNINKIYFYKINNNNHKLLWSTKVI